CLDYLEKNLDWFVDELSKASLKDKYLLLDLPGQVELVTNHSAVPKVLDVLEKRLGYRLTVVNLVPSHLILHPHLYLSALLLSLQTMLHLPYPFISILSKLDTLSPSASMQSGTGEDSQKSRIMPANPLPARLSTYLSANSLDTLLTSSISDDPVMSRYHSLTESLVSLVEDFGLVGFLPLAVEDLRLIMRVAKDVDHAAGYYPANDKEVDFAEVRVPRKWAGGTGLSAGLDNPERFNLDDLTDADYFDDLNMEEFFDTIEEEYLGEREEVEFESGDDEDRHRADEADEEMFQPKERFDGRESRRLQTTAAADLPPVDHAEVIPPVTLDIEEHSHVGTFGSPFAKNGASQERKEGFRSSTRLDSGSAIKPSMGTPLGVSDVDLDAIYGEDYLNDPRLRRAIP
ncbi:hypothetical protein HDU93_009185, partial [Gonapodya sp. JEL0774]